MPDRQYRFRGSVEPSAEVARPVALHAATSTTASGAKTTSATVDIFDVIDSYGGWWGISAGDVDRALKQAGDVDVLYVRLNSPGGEAQEGVAIANLLRAHKANVRVTVYGMAASAASVIAIAGDSVSMAPGSMLMIHEAWDIAFGDIAEMNKTAAALEAVNDNYADLYALKAGGTREAWRAVMHEEKWYPAADAVAAKLADVVGLDPQLPAGLPPVEDDTEDADLVIVNVDVEFNPAARAAARRFDLSMYRHAPAALMRPQTPAAPADGSTKTQERSAAVAFTDEQLTTMRQTLGVADDADETAILAALGEALAERADPPAADPIPAGAVDTAAVVAALEADGKIVMSKAKADALTEQAQLGAEARAKQLGDERDELIEAAMSAGKINRSAESRASWEKEFTRDPAQAKADLESLPARFPVGDLKGHIGDPDVTSTQVFSDDEAAALGGLVGATKEALLS